MYTLDEFIRTNDKDNKVKNAIASCLTENMTKEVAVETLASDLQVKLYGYILKNDDLSIDDGSNVRRAFTKEIEKILSDYFKDNPATNKELRAEDSIAVKANFDDVEELLNYKEVIIKVDKSQLEMFRKFMQKAMISHTNRIDEDYNYYYIYNCDVDSVDTAEEHTRS